MKGCSSALNIANIRSRRSNRTRLEETFQQFPQPTSPITEPEHAQRTMNTVVSEKPPTESDILACIQKILKNGKPDGYDGICAGTLKSFPSSAIRQMAKIIRYNRGIPD
ncbi:hypothetical protein RB195_017961 [Necator americanus]|uniref:Reverse transcriptase domain-containing protein n=1 Tax=Necator americanus TaxID=51031 RepID=A0ABR1CB57_NECAM